MKRGIGFLVAVALGAVLSQVTRNGITDIDWARIPFVILFAILISRLLPSGVAKRDVNQADSTKPIV